MVEGLSLVVYGLEEQSSYRLVMMCFFLYKTLISMICTMTVFRDKFISLSNEKTSLLLSPSARDSNCQQTVIPLPQIALSFVK